LIIADFSRKPIFDHAILAGTVKRRILGVAVEGGH